MIIDGKKIASEVKAEVAGRVKALNDKGVKPCLAVILVGDDPASVSYVKSKQKALEELGMVDRTHYIPEADATTALLVGLINGLNKNPNVHGILVQLPLPKKIDEKAVINAILPEKDVDGFTPINVGNMVIGDDCFIPCTPNGVIRLLKSTGIETNGKKAVVIGRSNIVGKPMSILLSRKDVNCTVTMCHTGTSDLKSYTKDADIIVVASGKPNTLTVDMVKFGAVVVDVGVNRIPDTSKKSGYRLVGDCDFRSIENRASFITPVPGGVGPMTIAMLMENTVKAAENLSEVK